VTSGVDVEIRWSDVDAYGHVSHIAIVALAEHARSRWLDAVLESEGTWDYAIARLELDYRSPLLFADRFAHAELAAERVGPPASPCARPCRRPTGASSPRSRA
jgi:acyl-CoA thioesterase FadM